RPGCRRRYAATCRAAPRSEASPARRKEASRTGRARAASPARARATARCGGTCEAGRRDTRSRRKSTHVSPPCERRDGLLRHRLEADVFYHRLARGPRGEFDPLREELPHRAHRGEQRQRDEDPREAVDLAACEQAEDDEE